METMINKLLVKYPTLAEIPLSSRAELRTLRAGVRAVRTRRNITLTIEMFHISTRIHLHISGELRVSDGDILESYVQLCNVYYVLCTLYNVHTEQTWVILKIQKYQNIACKLQTYKLTVNNK